MVVAGSHQPRYHPGPAGAESFVRPLLGWQGVVVVQRLAEQVICVFPLAAAFLLAALGPLFGPECPKVFVHFPRVLSEETGRRAKLERSSEGNDDSSG